ncbi:MAG: LamG-like jellyroll fold domain-containing protein, partial [Psychroserpens sp.]|uniref:LamG-like jellyroll fold domain-containing protein n=1 Tax=Psychroserpens sp. TaxID=2020870 RepID=UPI003001B6EB
MKRFYFQLSVALFFLCSFNLNAQNSGIFDAFVITESNGNGNFYNHLVDQGGFNGADLGNFTCNNTLTLKGGQIKTFKNGGHNVFNASLFYRVYSTGNPSGNFNEINLNFSQNLPNNGDQEWDNVASGNSENIDILSGLLPGNYTLEVYGRSQVDTDGINGTDLDNYWSNNSNYYKATFTVVGDTTAPSINFSNPNDSTITDCGTDLIVTPPTVTDNCTNNTALDFDGTNDYINLGSPLLSPTSGSQAHTVEMWVKTTPKNEYTILFNQYGYGPLYSYRSIFYINTDTYGGNLVFFKGSGVNLAGTTNLLDNQWHHVAMVRENSGTLSLYVDGIVENVGLDTYPYSNTNSLLGGQTLLPGNYYNGVMDEARIWNRALSAGEISNSYNKIATGNEQGLAAYYDFEDGTGSTNLTNKTGNLNVGVLTNMDINADWVTSTAPITNAALTNDFNGTSDASGNYPLGETVVTWTATDASGNTNTLQQTINSGDTTPPTAIAQNVTVQLDASGNGSITAAQVDNGSSDDCGIASITINNASFDCDDLGSGSVSREHSLTFAINGSKLVKNHNSILNGGSSLTLEAWVNPSGNGSLTSGAGGIIINKENEYEIARFVDGSLRYAFYNQNPGWQWINTGINLPLNEWNHVSVTFNNGQIRAYKNGDHLYTYNGSGSMGVFNQPLTIGNRFAFNQEFEGFIDEVRIWNVARSTQDIQADYASTLTGTETGLTLYYPMEEGSGTIVNDLSGHGLTGNIQGLQWNNNPAPTQGINEVTLTVTDVNGNTNTATASVTVEDNVPPTITCQDVTLYLDDTGNAGLGANSVNDFSGTQGQGNWSYGQYFAFDSNGFVEMPNYSQINIYADTFDAWNNTGQPPFLTSSLGHPGQDLKWAVRRWTSNMDGTIYISGDFFDFDTGGGDGANIRILKNGNQVLEYLNIPSVSESYAINLSVVQGDVIDFAIDPKFTYTYDTTHFTANIAIVTAADNCALDNISLSTSSFDCSNIGGNSIFVTATDMNTNESDCAPTITVVDAIAPTAICQDVTLVLDGNGQATLTATQVDNGSSDNCGAVTLSIDQTSFDCNDISPDNFALNFDGVNDYVQLPGSWGGTETSELTIEAWVFVDATTSGAFQAIASSYTADFVHFQMYQGGGNNVVYVNTGAAVLPIIPQTQIQTWKHVALVAKSGDSKVYVNGIQVGGTIATTFANLLPTTNLSIGRGNQGGRLMKGSIDELRIWDNAKTQAEITTAMDKVLSGTESGLLAYYDFNDGSGSTLTDKSGNGKDGTLVNMDTASDWVSGAPSLAGQVPVTLTVTDSNNNTSTCTATITVEDNIDPTITCPLDIDAFATSTAGAVVNYTAPVGTDNCSATTTLLSGPASGATFPIGNTVVSYQVTDGTNTPVTCSFNVEVIGVAPNIQCPSNITVNNDANKCGANVTFAASDTVGIPDSTITYSHVSGSEFPVGITTVTATATNAVGTSECTFTITVNDTEDPSFNDTSEIALYSNDFENPNITPVDDYCAPDISVFQGINNLYGSGFQQIFTVETIRINGPGNLYNDPSGQGGNYAIGIQQINQDDRLALTFDAQNKDFLNVKFDLSSSDAGGCEGPYGKHVPVMRLRLYDSPGGNFNINASGTPLDQVDVTGTSNGATSYTFDWTTVMAGLDASGSTDGNVSLEFDLITAGAYAAFDNLEITASDVSIENDCPADISLNATSAAGAVVTYAAPVGLDNCPNATTTLITPLFPSGATFPIGVTTVTYEVTDAANNTAQCSFTVTVTGLLPEIVCPADITQNNDVGQCGAVVTFAATDSVGIPASVITYSHVSGSEFPVGTTTVTATATNAVGSSECTFTITVNDIEDPTIACAADVSENTDPGLCTADLIITPPTFSDNCATSGSTSSAPPVTNGLLYFYDFSGNANDVWGGNNGTVSGPTLTSNSCDDPNSAYNFAGTGTGQRVSLGNEGTFAYPTGSFTLSAWVKGDNFASGTNTILDINFASSSVVARNSGIWLRVSSTGVPYLQFRQVGESTWSSVVVGSSSIPSGEWHQITAVRDASNGMSYLYVDGVDVGSVATANAAIDYDAEAYEDNSVNIGRWKRDGDPGCCEFNGSIDQVGIFNTALTPAEVATLSANPCPPTVLTNNYTNTDDASGVYPVGTTTVTWTATDAAGNTATCDQIVTVTDNELPVISCPSDITSVLATSASGSVVNYTAPVGTDNCPSATTALITTGFASGATFPIGVTTVTYQVTDAANNTAQCSFTVTVSGLAPDIVCPGNITVSNDLGDCGANVSFTATETTAIPASTITYSPASGSEFPVGTTTVTATATNAVGTSECTFTVTVNDTEDLTIACEPTVNLNNDPGECFGTTTLTPPTVTDICPDNALDFDGVNDYVSIPHNASLAIGSNPVSVECWFTAPNTNQTGTIVAKRQPVSPFNMLAIYINDGTDPVYNPNPGKKLTLTFGNSGSISMRNITTVNDVVDGGTHHLAAVVDPVTQTLKLYIDGVLQAVNTISPGAFPSVGNTQPFTIGQSNGNVGFLNVKVDELRIWNRARTQTEIQANMNTELNTTPGLVASYHFNEGVANGNNAGIITAIDASGNGNDGTLNNFALTGDTSNWVGQSTITNNAPATFDIGSTTVKWTATDAAGNTTTCDQIVIVTDDEDPEISCPSDIDVIATSASGAVVNYTAPTGTDNCPNATTALVTTGYPSGATFPIGVTTVTYEVTDAANNTEECSFTVTVTGVLPEIVCPADITQNNDVGQCGAVVTFAATDSVGIPASTITYDIQPGSFFDVTTTTVTATATNAIGSTSCTFTVTVIDNEAPEGGSQFPAPALALSNIPEAANYNLVYELNIPNTASWNTNSQVSYAVNNAAALTNIPFTRVAYMMELDGKWVWVSFDQITQNYNQIGIPADYVKQQAVSNMNVFASTNAGVTTGTEIQTGNVEFWSDCYYGGAGNGSIPSGNNGLYDFNDNRSGGDCYGSFQVHNYGIAESLLSYNRWSNSGNSDLGIGNQVGGSGHPDWTFAINAATYNTKKIYVLALSSSVVCNDVTLTLDTSGQATLNLAQVNTGVTDNCGVASSVLSQTSFDCSNIGENTVTLTITDIHGNSSTCSSTVTVEDNIDPTLDFVPADVTIECTEDASSANTGLATGLDNCGNVVITENSTEVGGCGNTKVITRTWTATDDNNNSTSAIQTITVEDTTAPSLTLPANATVECTNPTDPSATGSATGSDTCGTVAITFSDASSPKCGNTETITRTWTATDACGNATSADQIITVVDTTVPTIDVDASDLIVDCDGAGNAAELATWLASNGTTGSASDVCSGVVWTYSDATLSDLCGATGAATVTFTATDDCGNFSTTSATFTIKDDTVPTIDVPASDLTVDCDGSGNGTELATWLSSNGTTGSASDVCSGVVWSNDFSSLSDLCGATGAATVTFTATDDCGNFSTTTATFTIKDDTVPTIGTQASDLTVECDGSIGASGQFAAWLASNGGTGAASDVCSGVVWTHNSTGLSDDCGATGAETVTFTATD